MSSLGIHNVKLCVLCGTLNHESNGECWTCRWHGEYSRDARIIGLAWQRLETLHEEVRMEHVTSRRQTLLDDFGMPHSAKGLRAILLHCAKWWQRLQTQRDLRSAQREAGLKSRLRSRPDHLGV